MISFYKPQSSNNGTACSFYMNSNGDFFSELLKQKTWDSKRKIGTFNKETKVSVKWSQLELAEMLNLLEGKQPKFSAFHKSQKQVVKVLFAKSDKYDGAYSLSVTREASDDSTNQQKYFLGVYANEATLLREHLKYLLQESFRVNDAKFSRNDEPSSGFGKKETLSKADTAYGSKVQEEDDDMEW